jgi:hypothetical protein
MRSTDYNREDTSKLKVKETAVLEVQGTGNEEANNWKD